MNDVEAQPPLPQPTNPPSRRVTIKEDTITDDKEEEDDDGDHDDVEKAPQKVSKSLERKSSVVLKKYGMVWYGMHF